MTSSAAVLDARRSEPTFTGDRLFGLLVGGLCAPPIGLAGASAAVPLFDPTPGAMNASPEAFANALWISALAAVSGLMVWGLLIAGRRIQGVGARLALAFGWTLTITLLLVLADVQDGRFHASLLNPVVIPVVIMAWMLSVPSAFVLGGLALVLARSASAISVAGLVAAGAIVAGGVGFVLPHTPLYWNPDGIVGPLGFWIPTGVFTMGCCAAASSARWV